MTDNQINKYNLEFQRIFFFSSLGAVISITGVNFQKACFKTSNLINLCGYNKSVRGIKFKKNANNSIGLDTCIS